MRGSTNSKAKEMKGSGEGSEVFLPPFVQCCTGAGLPPPSLSLFPLLCAIEHWGDGTVLRPSLSSKVYCNTKIRANKKKGSKKESQTKYDHPATVPAVVQYRNFDMFNMLIIYFILFILIDWPASKALQGRGGQSIDM